VDGTCHTTVRGHNRNHISYIKGCQTRASRPIAML
jgi:hypothetical protein